MYIYDDWASSGPFHGDPGALRAAMHRPLMPLRFFFVAF